jgi:hypothetical protein
MVRGDIVKRIWSKNSQISEHTDILDIWDSGSHIFERWPNGDEYYWRVISRDANETGFTEMLEQQAPWETPGHVMRRVQMALLQNSSSQFHLGSWSIEQVTQKACNSVVVAEEQKKHKSFQKHYNKRQTPTKARQEKI